MSFEVSNSFVRQYERDAHEVFQREGSLLRNSVRYEPNVEGTSTTFQRVGKGRAVQKARHGKIPTMNQEHTPIVCTLRDYYAGDWVDRLDEEKLSINERQVLVNGGAWAVGRSFDDVIFNAAEQATQTAATTAGGFTLAKVFEAFEILGNNDVFERGANQVFCIVSPKGWTDLMAIDQFSNADYVGLDGQTFRTGYRGKFWMDTIFIKHSGLKEREASSVQTAYWYHKTAIGTASGSELQTDITWHGDRAAHFVNNMMSFGSCLIDPTGVVRIRHAA